MNKLRDHGMALGNLLMLTIVLFALLTISAGTWIVQMNLSSKGSAREGARRLSEATVQCAVARLIKDPEINGASLPTLTLSLPSYAGGEGWLAFKKESAAALNRPLSVNNLKGTLSVPGWGDTVVSPAHANLVAVGRYRGAECRTEVILHVPTFPYVVASTVPLKSLGGLSVFGVSDPSALAGGFGAIPEDKKVPGHLMTNAADISAGVPALQLLGGSTLIKGDAKAFGNVLVGPGAQVDGEVRPYAERAQLPVVDVGNLDTAGKPGCSNLVPGDAGATQLSGFYRCPGDLNFANGLELKGGVLFVNGGLTITGGLKGKGAILATGPVSVSGGSSLDGDNQTAIIARGKVSLQGNPSQSSEFRGLVYTEGSLDCRYANIAGAVVVNNPDPTGSATLEKVAFAEIQSLASISTPVVVPLAKALQPGPFFAYHSGALGNNDFGLPTVQDVDSSGTPHDVIANANMNFNNMDYNNPPPGFPVTHPKTAAEPWIEIGVPNPMPADPITLGCVRICNIDPTPGLLVHTPDGSYWQQDRVQDFTSYNDARAGITQMVQDWGGNTGAVDGWLQEAQRRMCDKVGEYVSAYNSNSRIMGQSAGSPDGTVIIPWKLDLSQFYTLSERIRVLSWRTLQ